MPIDGDSAEATFALAQYLIELADGMATSAASGAPRLLLPLTQQDLASLVGVSRNSLVRAFTRLRSQRLIATEGRTVTILDMTSLRNLAEQHAADAAEA